MIIKMRSASSRRLPSLVRNSRSGPDKGAFVFRFADAQHRR